MGFVKSDLSKGKLRVELIPRTTFYNNLRAILSKGDWDYLRKQIYRKYNYKCAICSGVGKNHPVECHELWSFNEQEHIQRLDGLIALCPDCHSVVHYGLAEIRGYSDKVFKHFKKINKWDDKKTQKHIQEAFELWEKRSSEKWKVDLTTFLKKVGLDRKKIC